MTEKQLAKEPLDSHLSNEEAQKALAAISDADIIRLRKLEKLFLWASPAGTPLADAIIKTLEGVRSWKRGMTAYQHLYGVMRSLASSENKKKTVEKNSEAFVNDNAEENHRVHIAEYVPSPEQLLIEQIEAEKHHLSTEETVQEILDLFSDDENATWVLMGTMDGQQAEEIRQLSGMDKKAYDAARKRISRKIEKHYPDQKRT